VSYSLSDLWSEDAARVCGVQARDPPDGSSTLGHAPLSPFVRCTPEQWKKVVSTLYAALHLTLPSALPPQQVSLMQVIAVIWRAKAFRKQIPPKGAFSFTPVCPLVWKPGLCDLCGSPLYPSSYGWPNRWRCDACILAMQLTLGFLAPDHWLTGQVAGCEERTQGDRVVRKES
jgi:hypothetical protein